MRTHFFVGISALAITGCSGHAYQQPADSHNDVTQDSSTGGDAFETATSSDSSPAIDSRAATDSALGTDSSSGDALLTTDAHAPADAIAPDTAPDALDAFSEGIGVNISSAVAAAGKVDLLVEIDNSMSMADKQSELAKRIPAMIDQLVATNPKTGLPYVTDIHVAVITSSLGTYGDGTSPAANPNPSTGWSDVCAYFNGSSYKLLYGNDHGHLLPRDHDSAGNADSGVTGLQGWQMSGAQATQASCPSIQGGNNTLALHWAYQGAGYAAAVASGVSLESDGNDVANAATLELAASCEVASAKEFGCGYENNLEAAYHFLIDPHPFNALSGIPVLAGSASCYAGNTSNCNIILSPPAVGYTGPFDAKNNADTAASPNDDAVILTQRANFLRPDSLLAVVFISDENDVSLNPTSAGPLTWMPWTFLPGNMFRGTTGCANVNDSNDFSYCNQNGSSCTWCENYTGDVCGSSAAQSDPNCKLAWPSTTADTSPLWNADRDSNNLRGWNQIQRFGFSFLWPRDRYVTGFTQATVTDRFGNTSVNPIFAGGRTTDHLVVASIVGVPDHLVPKTIDAATNTQVPLASDKWAQSDWDAIIGPLGVRDAHMIESIGERSFGPNGMAKQMAAWGYSASQGLAEYKGYNTTAGSADLSADPPSGSTIVQPSTGLAVPYNGNGGERHKIDFVVSSSNASPSDGDFDDLQFACMGARSVTTASHDCQGSVTWAWQPECSCTGVDCATAATANTNWGNTSASVTQPYYKAYPGLRYLRMINALGSSGYAASICAPSFEPAMIGIVNKIRGVLSGQCFAGAVPQDADGTSNCILIETIPPASLKAGVSMSTAHACEAIGLCTPGAASCNRSAQSSFPPDETPTGAAGGIVVALNIGGATIEQVGAGVDPGGSGNVIIPADAGPEQIVCEVPQLTGTDLTSCVADPTYTLPATVSSGWCYAHSAAAITAFGCSAGTGDVRVFGAATTQPAGSGLYLECKAK